ncbi:MAG: HAD hydrolase-like protein [Cardiobacteriaceae bacterium]|nr:HAD hydrolase-like protein [Cardiobacteriaceae bacterium]
MSIFNTETPATLAYSQYQSIRDILPQNNAKKTKTKIKTLLDIADDFDNFFFDAYGVLNTADGVIPEALATISELKKRGKNCLVISNAAGFAREFYLKRYKKMGFNFNPDEVVVSRDVAMQYLIRKVNNNHSNYYGIISGDFAQNDIEEIINKDKFLLPDNPDFGTKSDIFLFLGSMNWNKEKQTIWTKYLQEKPREIWVGNPDLIAPKGLEASIEAGTYTLLLEKNLYTKLLVCGKPFEHIFNLAKERITAKNQSFNFERSLMVGDTLHTDILGGNNFGIKTALAVNYGFFKGLNYSAAIMDSGIEPDFILEAI